MEELDIRWYIERFRGIVPKKHGEPDPVYIGYIESVLKILNEQEAGVEGEPPISIDDSLVVENGVIVELEPAMWQTLCDGVKKSGRKQSPEIIVVLPPGTNNIDLSKPLTVVVHKEQEPVEAHIIKESTDDTNNGAS